MTPINPGQLRQRVSILAKTRTPDGAGGFTYGAAQTFATVWAYVKPLEADEANESMRVVPSVTHEVTVRYLPDISADMLVVLEGRTLDIVAQPLDVAERGELLTLQCREIIGQITSVAPPSPATLVGIALTPATADLLTGETQQFQVIASYSDSSTADVTAFPIWDVTGGTIDGAGLFTAGTTEGASFHVSATYGGFTDSCAVTVTAFIQSLALTPASVSLEQGKTQQFAVSGHYSDGSDRDHTLDAVYVATGGSITTGGLYTAGFTLGGFDVTATVAGISDSTPVTITVLTQYFQNFADYAIGAIVPDLGRLRVSDSNVGWNHKLRVGTDRFSNKALILSGTGADSRPWAWLAPPTSPFQETYVEISTTVTGLDSCGAIVSCSVLADGKNYNEYGARFYSKAGVPGNKGFQLWKYFGVANSFTMLDLEAADWTAGVKMCIRLRRDSAGVHTKYWPKSTTEPSAWMLEFPHDATVPGGKPGVYVNNVSSGAQIHCIGIGIEGSTAPTSGANVSTATPTPTLPGFTHSANFDAATIGLPPTGWTPAYVTSGVTWTVETVDGSPAVHSVKSSASRTVLDKDDIPNTTTNVEVLLRFKPTSIPDFGDGVAICVEGAPTDSAYAMFASNTGVAFCSFVNDVFNNQGASPFECVANAWHWGRFKRVGSENLGKIWLAAEPEPAKWMRWMTDLALSVGSVALYHYAGDTCDYDEFYVKVG